jgi:carboxyl-terminal processing protease
MKARTGGAVLLESPDASARQFGRLGGGTAATVTATAGDFTKVALGDGRFGFVKSSELESGGTASPSVAYEETMRRFPPVVDVQPVALAVKDDKITIRGAASDGDRLLDGYVFVGNRKVFYHSNRNGADPKKMSFDTPIPLRPGVNVITVVARENPDTIGRRTLIIRRDGPNGEPLQTPKTDEDLEASGADD